MCTMLLKKAYFFSKVLNTYLLDKYLEYYFASKIDIIHSSATFIAWTIFLEIKRLKCLHLICEKPVHVIKNGKEKKVIFSYFIEARYLSSKTVFNFLNLINSLHLELIFN